MALILTEEQRMLKDAAHSFLNDRAPVGHLRELRDAGDKTGFSRKLWSEFADMGWTAVLVPEEYGGLGYGYTGIGTILEQCGRTLTPSPLLSTAMLGVAILGKAGSEAQQKKILPQVAAGEHLLALAVDEGDRHEPDHCDTTAVIDGDRIVLNGTKRVVLDGHIADTIIVSAATDSANELSLILVPAAAAGVEIEHFAMFDTHHAATIRLKNVALDKSDLIGTLGAGRALLDFALDVGRIGQAAELLGIADETFARTVRYLQERKQFGVPIGSFQALQHRAAVLYGELELCRSVVLRALHALDDDAENIAEIASMTKAKLAETAHSVALEGVQMHGGIGMTDEFDIGFFLKRCQILETIYGDRYFHLDRYARLRGF